MNKGVTCKLLIRYEQVAKPTAWNNPFAIIRLRFLNTAEKLASIDLVMSMSEMYLNTEDLLI